MLVNILVSLLLLLGIASPAAAALIDRGGGLIYDDTLDITWLQDANMARTTGLSKDGLMTAAEAMKWAADLVYQGYTDWRLPDARTMYRRDPKYGWKIKTSELGHLYYVELGNGATLQVEDRSGLKNSGPFRNLQPFRYWSGTQYNQPSDFWWYFDMGNGYQWDGLTSAGSYAWAVRDGDSISAAPNGASVPSLPAYTLSAPPDVEAIPGTEVSVSRDEKATMYRYRNYWWRPFAGRWYRSAGYNGPWAYVRPKMVPNAVAGLLPDKNNRLSVNQ